MPFIRIVLYNTIDRYQYLSYVNSTRFHKSIIFICIQSFSSLDPCHVWFDKRCKWVSCCMQLTSLGVYRRPQLRKSQRLMFFLESVFLDDLLAIAAIGTAYKSTDAGCAIRVVYAGKAEARPCHHCLVLSPSLPLSPSLSPSLALSLSLPLSLSLSLSLSRSLFLSLCVCTEFFFHWSSIAVPGSNLLTNTASRDRFLATFCTKASKPVILVWFCSNLQLTCQSQYVYDSLQTSIRTCAVEMWHAIRPPIWCQWCVNDAVNAHLCNVQKMWHCDRCAVPSGVSGLPGRRSKAAKVIEAKMLKTYSTFTPDLNCFIHAYTLWCIYIYIHIQIYIYMYSRCMYIYIYVHAVHMLYIYRTIMDYMRSFGKGAWVFEGEVDS